MPNAVCSRLGLTATSEKTTKSTQGTKTSALPKSTKTDSAALNKPTTTSPNDQSPKALHRVPNSLDIGAKVGIAIGVIIAIGLLFLISILFYRRHMGRRIQLPAGESGVESKSQSVPRHRSIKAFFLPSWKSELSGDSAPAELEGSNPTAARAELSSKQSIVELSTNLQEEPPEAQPLAAENVTQERDAVQEENPEEQSTTELKEDPIAQDNETEQEDDGMLEEELVDALKPPPIPYTSKPRT